MKLSARALAFALALGTAAPLYAQAARTAVFGGANFTAPTTMAPRYGEAPAANSSALPYNYGAYDAARPTYAKPTSIAARAAQEEVAAPQPQPHGVPAVDSSTIYGHDGAAPAGVYSGWGGLGGCEQGYGSVDDCGCFGGGCPKWGAYVGGLFMGRNGPNNFWTTYETNNNPNQLMYFPHADWGGGVDTRLTYWFGCPSGDGCMGTNPYCNCCYENGIEVLYWGVWGMDAESSLYSPSNQLSTPINLGNVLINGNQAADFFDNARSHRLTRDDEIHNIELNLLHIPCCTGFRNLNVTWLAGVRYFRFSEALEFDTLRGTVPPGAQFGEYPASEAYLDVDVENNLVGFQLGARADYCLCDRWSIFAIPKAGIYGNHITAQNSLYQGNGNVAIFEDTGNEFDLDNSTNEFSFLASIDLGFTYAFTPNCLLNAGYRVVAVSGVALGDNQIPAYLAAEDEWNEIDTNGDLIVHGGFAGLELRF